MKAFYKFFIAALLFGSYTQANAQNLATWHFENPVDSGTNPSTAPTSTSTGVTASNAIATGVTNVSVTHPGSDGSGPNYAYYAMEATGWPTANALDPGKYYEFTITPQASCSLTLNGFQIGDHRIDGDLPNQGGTGNYSLRSSADGFASDLVRSGGGTQDPIDANFTAATFSNGSNPGVFGAPNVYTGPFTVRIYYFNMQPYPSSTSPNVVRIDRLRYVGRVNCPVAQPVEFSSFAGKAVGNRVQLSWATSWERNADRFEIERSQNASEFGSIGQVKAAGDATQKQVYGFTDEQALTGVNYYRLRQVDRDGSIQFSKIIAVTTRPDAQAIAVLGNPTEGVRINLQLFNLEASKLELTDMQGRSLPFRVVESGNGTVTLEPTASLSSGIYLIRAAKVAAVKILVR